MTRRSSLRLTVPAALSALALFSACGPEATNESLSSEQAPLSTSRNHVMKMTTPGPVADSKVIPFATTPHLNNYGGPILTHVNVIPVYWNANVAFQSNLNSFYATIPASSTIYTSLLTQYGVGTGTRGTPFVDSQGTGSITDATIQNELTALFNAGKIPLPNGSNYYPVHFPSGVSITASDGSQSCVVWCAYHGTYVYNGVNVNYGVVPDQGGGCAGGCGSNSQRVNNLTSVSSHELVEATTDPAVGLATTFAPPLAWYDPNNGEIGDICNAQQASLSGFVVQKEWSNSKKACTTN